LKVFFFNNGMPHYYNLVLNKLNEVPGIELTLIVPSQVSENIGEGVFQTRDGVFFRVIELHEYKLLGLCSSFRGVARLLFREKPGVIITSDRYLFSFLINVPVVLLRKNLDIKLIMKSIPFRIPTYQEAKLRLKKNADGAERIPGLLNKVFAKLGISILLRSVVLSIKKYAYNIPDAHVNYVDEAFTIYGSYGVSPEKIFITQNSPDTDLLFSVRESLKLKKPILAPCKHRLVHVGRLVAWKRVDMLLKAFVRIKKKYDDAELLVIGMGPEEDKLKNLCANLGVNRSVRFLGGVYDPQLLGHYLLSSQLYVLAGMGGLSINEAMCFGLPILCSVGDGTEKKLVREEINGKYFIDGDEEDLAVKIDYLFAHPDLMARMGVKSTEIIRNEINIHTVIEGYRKAITYVCAR
jgi:glycosyltransferase involved in cell wall biosynthesis